MSTNLFAMQSHTLENEAQLQELLDKKELTFSKEIKEIPNEVLGLKLRPFERCESLLEDNPYKEVINYSIRYKLESGITGVWRFTQKYGFNLKKDLSCQFGINQLLYIKEPFLVDANDNTKIHYQFNSINQDNKFRHQRYMKVDQARYFIQVTNIEIIRIKNFYLNNVKFETSKDEDDIPLVMFPNEHEELKKENIKLEQRLFSHKYLIKYTCKLVDNPFNADIVPDQKTRFFYRIQIPLLNQKISDGHYIWRDFEVGYIYADDKKDARALLEKEFDTKLPMKVTKGDDIGSRYKFLVKIFPPDDYWDNFWGKERECDLCGHNYTLIDKINNYGSKGDVNYCCEECHDVAKENLYKIREEEKINKTMENNDGIHNPCIYKISNLKTGMIYIGQTTQAITFRWYQHFASPKSGSKFHQAIQDSHITDWCFEVLEVITNQTFKEKNINYHSTGDKQLYINQREQHWISEFDSIENGYNSATANKEVSEIKKMVQSGLFNEEDLTQKTEILDVV